MENEINNEINSEEARMRYLAEIIKAVSHPARLCIVKKLYLNGSCNVSYFTSCMSTSQSGVSQHLSKLRNMGLVTVERKGTEVYYSLVDEDLIKIVKALFEEDK